MRRCHFGLLLALVLTLVPSLRSPATAAAAEPVRIMAMGSSTTAGSIPGGYRSDLFHLLTSAGGSVDFVGSVTDAGPPQLPDRDHEGHGGWVIDHMTEVAADRMQTYQPDVVLLHAGANDVLQNLNLDTAPDRLETLISTLLSVRPAATIYVATVGPMADPATQARAATFNNAIPAVVDRLVTAGHPVRSVDSRSALQPTDVAADGIHLTHSGNSKLAAVWYGAMAGKTLQRFEAETAQFTGLAHSAATPNASNNGKAGWLDDAASSATITVDAPHAGDFRVFIRGGNGTGTGCSHTLSVNGAAGRVIDYPSFGWENWTQRALDITLHAGANALTFTHRSCFAELDSIDLVLG